MSTIELKPTVQSTPKTRAEGDPNDARLLRGIDATPLISRAQVARQLVQQRVVDQRQEAQLYQTEWSPSEAQHRSSRRHAAGDSAASARVDEARAQLTEFLAQKNVRRQRGSVEERELKRLTELYGEASESLLHLRLVRRGAKGNSLLESSQEELASLLEKPKEGTERVSPLDLGGSEAHEGEHPSIDATQHTLSAAPAIQAPVRLTSSLTIQKDEAARGQVTPENSRAALQALLADIAQISPVYRRR